MTVHFTIYCLRPGAWMVEGTMTDNVTGVSSHASKWYPTWEECMAFASGLIAKHSG